ncbi:cupin domain-containing protein [Leucobacter soli]|uniref:cupin domain-containing protein n=1 Tax=Leucobacter soli TaxID=2812850 RepID=UPI00361B4AAD
MLSGRLRLRLGERNLVLTHGEAAEFDTRIPHAMSADGRRPAQVISIFNDAGERMHTRLAQETTEDQTPEAQKNGTTPSE